MSLTPEQIEANWQRFTTLCERVGDHRVIAVKNLCEALGERFALAPASSRLEHHNAFPGGLVDHSLRVLANASAVAKATNVTLVKESLIISALFHDLGKVGTEDADGDYYLPQESEWHRNQLGEMYRVNKKIQYMTIPHRGLYLLQRYGVTLSMDEFIAIMIHDGQHCQENKPYSMQEPMLASILSVADFLATKQEKSSNNTAG